MIDMCYRNVSVLHGKRISEDAESRSVSQLTDSEIR